MLFDYVKTLYRVFMLYDQVKTLYRVFMLYNQVKTLYRVFMLYNQVKTLYRVFMLYNQVKTLYRIFMLYEQVKTLYRVFMLFDYVKNIIQSIIVIGSSEKQDTFAKYMTCYVLEFYGIIIRKYHKPAYMPCIILAITIYETMISFVMCYATAFTNLIRDIWQGTRIDENADPSDMSKPSGPQQWTHTILQIKI